MFFMQGTSSGLLKHKSLTYVIVLIKTKLIMKSYAIKMVAVSFSKMVYGYKRIDEDQEHYILYFNFSFQSATTII